MKCLPARNLFFDLDGTLLQSEADIRHAWETTLRELNLEVPDFDRIFRVGPSLNDISKVLFPQASPDLLQRIASTFKVTYDNSPLPDTRPFPGIDDWLEFLKRDGHRIFVLTNKRMKPTRMLLTRYGWDGLFEGVIAGDFFGESLPKTELLHRAIRLYNCTSDQTMVIGDTAEDIRAGQSENAQTCFCSWGYGALSESVVPDVILNLREITS